MDVSKVIEQIKQNNLKVGNLIEKIKQMEVDMVKLKNEADKIKANNKLIVRDVEYRRIILRDKGLEMYRIQKQYERWLEMMKIKNKNYEIAQKELGDLQKDIFQSRIKFNEGAKDFFCKYDYLICRREDVDEAIRRRNKENRILNDINYLEGEVTSLEKKYEDIVKELDLIEEMQKTKKALEKAPDSAIEFTRVQYKIDACEEELEDINLNLTLKAKPKHINFILSYRSPFDPNNSQFTLDDELQDVEDMDVAESNFSVEASILAESSSSLPSEVDSRKKRKGSFKLKKPSSLIKKRSISSQFSVNEIEFNEVNEYSSRS